MALYEIRNHSIEPAKAKAIHREHDKQAAIDWANAHTKETGKILDVVEIKHIHITSNMEADDFAFF